MKKLKTAILLLATATLPLSGMAQAVQQPSDSPAPQEQQGGTQLSQDDLTKAITQALIRQETTDENDIIL